MKQLQKEQIFLQVFGGTFADQKICKQCPNRFTREESFVYFYI
jgi:ubiquitin carboxyl-terminal hydrolase 9/24